MKRIIFSLFMLTYVGHIIAQGDYFKSAMDRGRTSQSFYILRNESKKKLLLEDLTKYCQDNNYIIGDHTTKEVSRFGDVATTIATFEFLPKYEYKDYLYSCLTNGKSFYSLTQKGTGYCYYNGRFYETTDIQWSGTIKDGLIQGKGEGYAWNTENGQGFVVSGEFDKGLPVNGLTKFTLYIPQTIGPYNSNNTVTDECKTESLSDGLLPIWINKKLGFVNTEGVICINPEYSALVKPFKDGTALVSRNDTTEIIIDKLGNYKGVTQKQQAIINERLRKKAEEERAAELARKKAEAEELARLKRQEEMRMAGIRSASEGDKIYYSEEFEHSNGVLLDIFLKRQRFNMRVVCFIEKIINKGERMQVRVASVESSSDRYYATPSIDGIKYSKGDILWIQPLYDKRWWR